MSELDKIKSGAPTKAYRNGWDGIDWDNLRKFQCHNCGCGYYAMKAMDLCPECRSILKEKDAT